MTLDIYNVGVKTIVSELKKAKKKALERLAVECVRANFRQQNKVVEFNINCVRNIEISVHLKGSEEVEHLHRYGSLDDINLFVGVEEIHIWHFDFAIKREQGQLAIIEELITKVKAIK